MSDSLRVGDTAAALEHAAKREHNKNLEAKKCVHRRFDPNSERFVTVAMDDEIRTLVVENPSDSAMNVFLGTDPSNSGIPYYAIPAGQGRALPMPSGSPSAITIVCAGYPAAAGTYVRIWAYNDLAGYSIFEVADSGGGGGGGGGSSIVTIGTQGKPGLSVLTFTGNTGGAGVSFDGVIVSTPTGLPQMLFGASSIPGFLDAAGTAAWFISNVLANQFIWAENKGGGIVHLWGTVPGGPTRFMMVNVNRAGATTLINGIAPDPTDLFWVFDIVPFVPNIT